MFIRYYLWDYLTGFRIVDRDVFCDGRVANSVMGESQEHKLPHGNHL